MVNNFENSIINAIRDSDFDRNNLRRFTYTQNNNNINNISKDKYPSDVWKYLKNSFSNIVKILKKDPLEELNQEDITSILISRDYICTIPSALELFLRAIDWRNPLEVSLAYRYLKKWAKIDFFDAVSLLDGRFPDTKVRKYAVERLNDFPDLKYVCLCFVSVYFMNVF